MKWIRLSSSPVGGWKMIVVGIKKRISSTAPHRALMPRITAMLPSRRNTIAPSSSNCGTTMPCDRIISAVVSNVRMLLMADQRKIEASSIRPTSGINACMIRHSRTDRLSACRATGLQTSFSGEYGFLEDGLSVLVRPGIVGESGLEIGLQINVLSEQIRVRSKPVAKGQDPLP